MIEYLRWGGVYSAANSPMWPKNSLGWTLEVRSRSGDDREIYCITYNFIHLIGKLIFRILKTTVSLLSSLTLKRLIESRELLTQKMSKMTCKHKKSQRCERGICNEHVVSEDQFLYLIYLFFIALMFELKSLLNSMQSIIAYCS